MNLIPFDLNRAIGLADARLLVRGKGGKPIRVETLRRWANPQKGCYPAGPRGPRILFPVHKQNGEVLTLREWIAAFEEERVRIAAMGMQLHA